MILYMVGNIHWSQIRDKQEIERRTAEAGLKVIEDAAKLKHEQGMLALATAKAAVEKSTPAVQPAVASYDCNTKASNDNGFRNQKLHELVEGQPLTATGCMWTITTKSVQSVSGSGFSLEVPFNETTSYKCPSAQVVDCASFLNEHKGKNFRILVNPDGNVTIN